MTLEQDFTGNKCKPPTQKELKWIESFKKLAKRCPESLWLYSAGGTMNVMKKPKDGKIMTESGGVDSDNIIGTVKIRNDGGDW